MNNKNINNINNNNDDNNSSNYNLYHYSIWSCENYNFTMLHFMNQYFDDDSGFSTLKHKDSFGKEKK